MGRIPARGEQDHADMPQLSAACLMSVLARLPVGIVILDSDGRFVYINVAGTDILAVAPAALIGHSYRNLHWTVTDLDGHAVPPYKRPIQAVMRTHRPQPETSLTLTSPAGMAVTVAVTAMPLDDAGQHSGYLLSFIDITARTRTERELRRLSRELDARVRQRTADLEAERSCLRAVLDAIPAGVVLLNPAGAFLETNAHFRRIWGGEAEDRVPMADAVDDYVAFCGWWADTQRLVAPEAWASNRALRGETVIAEVIDILRFDGTCGTILNAAAPIRDGDGHIIGAVVAIEDITDERERERAARTTAATLYTMFDQVPMGVALFDDHLVCRQINATYAVLAGSTIGEIIGKPLRELLLTYFAPETAQMLQARISRCLRTGKAYSQHSARMRLRTQPGTESYVDWFVNRIASEGVALGVLVTVTDVTEQTLARQQLEFERARWLTALMTIPLAVLFVTPDRSIAVDNEPAHRLWGTELHEHAWEEIINRVQLLAPDTGAPYHPGERPVARAMHGEAIHDFECVLQTPDGRRLPVLINAAPVRLDDEIVGVIQVTQDLTRLKAADRVKDEFLAMVTHDLRSPLAAMQGWTDFALETDDGELIREALHAILRSIAVQRALVEDLLDASALQAGTLSLQPTVQDVRPPIADVYASFEPIAREHGLQLVCEMPDTPLHANIDAMRIQQLVGNLLSNAVKYTPDGGCVILRVARDGEYITITVCDTGIGISQDMLPLVFERFFRATKTGERAKSLGLGLAIVKALTELHGGTVRAESAGINHGAVFTVTLPATAP